MSAGKPEHVCGPGAGCVNPRYSVTFEGTPILVLVVTQGDDGSPPESLIDSKVPPKDVPALLRHIAARYERDYRAGLS